MKDLSLHILDLVQNSISAGASLVVIEIDENLTSNRLTIAIKDNGCGMDKDFLEKVKDPFVTTRTSRKVGLGISLMLAACQRCGGSLEIASSLGVGTELTATFEHDHIDRAPMGSLADTMVSLVLSSNITDFLYTHRINEHLFCFDTREVKKILGEEVSLHEPDILNWIKDFINEGLSNIGGGVKE